MDFVCKSRAESGFQCVTKGREIRDTKTFNLLRNIVSLQVFVDVSRFSPCVINLSRNKNICCGLKKVVAKNRARVYFEQQILASLPEKRATKPNLILNFVWEISKMSVEISPLTEEDIAGASIRGRNPQQLTIPELKRWLSCRKGAKTNGKKRDLVER